MVFNSTTVVIALFLFFWLSTLTILVYRMIAHYNRLTHGVPKAGLKEILENLLQNQAGSRSRQETLEKTIERIELQDKSHIQRIGIVRYNPFSDTGGSQSFSLALLDGKANGIVMTSLYARTGNRWYVKDVSNGRGKELELSKEEETAVKKAEPIAHE